MDGFAWGLAADANGVPYVLSLNELFKWDGANWVSLGDVRVNPWGYRTGAAVAIDVDGNPWVAWGEAAAPEGVWALYVRKWASGGWSAPIGPVLLTEPGRSIARVALAAEPEGIAVAWDAPAGGETSHVGAARLNP